jgi:hypothetical protein
VKANTQRFSLFLFLLFVSGLEAVPVELSAFDPESEKRITRDESGIITLSPGGPVRLRATATGPRKAGETVLEGEIFSLGGCSKIIALAGPQFNTEHGLTLNPIHHNEAWIPYASNTVSEHQSFGDWKELQIEFHLKPEATLQLQNFRLREAKPEEFDERFDPSIIVRQQVVQNYLPAKFEAFIENVAVSKNEIQVTLRADKEFERLHLAEAPIYRKLDDPSRFEFMQEVSPEIGKPLTITLPRTRMRLGKKYDRLISRWQLIMKSERNRTVVSHGRYADTIEPMSPDLPKVKPSHQKGLGGWSAQRKPDGDLKALGISSITVNIPLHGLLSATEKPGHTAFQWQGSTFYASDSALRRHDQTMLEAAENNVTVSLVLLLGNPARSQAPTLQIMGHPDAHRDGAFSMPNMDSQAAVEMYGACLHLLAQRYSRSDGKYGRVHDYIVHNEVDAGWTWTNCGEKPLSYYIDFYHRSCRLVDLIAREQDSHARTYISLTHHWASTVSERYYPSRDVMEEFVRWTAVEGDFPWALAYHPYPQSLRNPRTWEDSQATMSFDTDKITPHNVEVIDAWMKRPEMRDRYGNTRPVHLSENGFNSPDYSEKSLTEQAAGMAYAWKKIQPLETVEVWHYHNWVDNRHEGGLRIGLRKFSDHTAPYQKKPIWYLYQALGTPRESELSDPYLPVVGLESWDQAILKMD